MFSDSYRGPPSTVRRHWTASRPAVAGFFDARQLGQQLLHRIGYADLIWCASIFAGVRPQRPGFFVRIHRRSSAAYSASKCSRDGQPSRTHSSMSDWRQRTEREILTGAGILSALKSFQHCRVLIRNRPDTSFTVNKSDMLPTPRYPSPLRVRILNADVRSRLAASILA